MRKKIILPLIALSVIGCSNDDSSYTYEDQQLNKVTEENTIPIEFDVTDDWYGSREFDIYVCDVKEDVWPEGVDPQWGRIEEGYYEVNTYRSGALYRDGETVFSLDQHANTIQPERKLYEKEGKLYYNFKMNGLNSGATFHLTNEITHTFESYDLVKVKKKL